MPAARPRRRHSSSESSDDQPSSSSDDDIFIPSKSVKATELTLKDDEGTIALQAPLPEEYGKRINGSDLNMSLDILGESDDDRRTTRILESSASGILDDEKKQQLAKKKRKRCSTTIFHRPMQYFHLEFILSVSRCANTNV